MTSEVANGQISWCTHTTSFTPWHHSCGNINDLTMLSKIESAVTVDAVLHGSGG